MDNDGITESEVDDVEPVLEEVEPEALPIEQADTLIEGVEGYDEEVVEDGDSVDPFGGDPDLSGETDQA